MTVSFNFRFQHDDRDREADEALLRRSAVSAIYLVHFSVFIMTAYDDGFAGVPTST